MKFRVILALFVLSATLLVTNMVSAESAQEILTRDFPSGGVIVHLGIGSEESITCMAKNTRYLVHVLDRDPGKVQAMRKTLAAKALYGNVTVAQLKGKRLPYTDNLVNILIAEKGTFIPQEEILRVIAPLGTAFIGKEKLVKPWPEGMDEWTHFLHGPDNNAVSTDTSVSRPLSLRWVESKPWGRSHDQLTSFSTMTTAGGVVFYIMDDAALASIRLQPVWKLVARDAFNGTRLWEKPILKWIDHRRWFRAGPSHLQRRMAAASDGLYVTLGIDQPVVKLHPRTGELLKTYAGTEHTEEIVIKDGVLYLLVGTSEIHTNIKGNLSNAAQPKPTKQRYLTAIDKNSGKELWRINARDENYVHPVGYAAAADKLFVHSIKGIECLDAKTGKSLWKTARSSTSRRAGWETSTLVATREVVLLADSDGNADSNVTYEIHTLAKAGKGCSLTAYDAQTGQSLWSAPAAFGYHSPVDVFVINSTVWIGPAFSKGYDLKTGQPLRTIQSAGPPVGMVHDRCHRNKAAGKYIFTARDGIEVINTERGWQSNNSWLRGACSYGIMPANGMLYVPPDACGCHPHLKLKGLNAMSSSYPEAVLAEPEPFEDRLQTGPAFSRLTELCKESRNVSDSDWPVFRGDSLRSGYCNTQLPQKPSMVWSTSLGGNLTQPVKAGKFLLVSSVDQHTVYAINADDGSIVWSRQVGGRVDSPPAIYRGVVLFGTSDGYVHCLETQTGETAWRFRAAPGEHLISSYGRLESSWPVHGSVLIIDNTCCFTAGRSTYMDGGLHFYKMDPATGKVLSNSTVSHIDTTTGKQTAEEIRGSFDSTGVRSDIMSGDGKSLFIKNMQFDMDGQAVENITPRLYSTGGMLEDNWFMRMYWHFGTGTKAGYAGWGKSYNGESTSYAGRIMCMDKKGRLFGYGRKGRAPDPSSLIHDSYHMFCASPDGKLPSPAKIEIMAPRGKKGRLAKYSEQNYVWSLADPGLVVKAMVLTPKTIAIAGFSDNTVETRGLTFKDNNAALESFRGGKGAELHLISTSNGKLVYKIEMKDEPVFDGLIAADGSLYLSTRGGKLIRFSEPDK